MQKKNAKENVKEKKTMEEEGLLLLIIICAIFLEKKNTNFG